MANILNFYESDGKTPLKIQTRQGVPYPLIGVSMTYSDEGGQGISEYLIRNVSADSAARRLLISTSQAPTNPDGGAQLLQEWSYQDSKSEVWGRYLPEIEVPEIMPGDTVRIRTRVSASSASEPVTHRGRIMLKYQRASLRSGT